MHVGLYLQIPFDISLLRMPPPPKVLRRLRMSKTFRRVTRMCPNIWNAHRIQTEFLECTSIVKECTTNFHSDGIPAHSGTRVTAHNSYLVGDIITDCKVSKIATLPT